MVRRELRTGNAAGDRETKMRIALFGGSFNPPHAGHLLAATYVRAHAGVDRVWLVPNVKHAFGKHAAPFELRAGWCDALAGLVHGVEVCRIEGERGLDGRTLTTLEALAGARPDDEFRLVIGTDILRETDKWHRFDDVARLAPPIILGRGGHPVDAATRTRREFARATWLDDVTIPEVSSTEVRARLATGADVSHLVPAPVLARLRTEWPGSA